MDHDSCTNLPNHGVDFTFGFNNVRFADRTLVIQVLADDVTHQSADNVADDSISSEGCIRVREVHVSCLLLAAKSPFFHKIMLFSNGMAESQQRRVTLRIHAAEEIAMMEILNCMYTGTLTSETSPALLDVLKLADKFQVVSCMRLCTSLLTKLLRTTESALLYLDLPSNLTMTDEVQLLVDAAKQILEAEYKDIENHPREIMKLPLAGIKAMLSSDVLEVPGEDKVFDIALEWTETHYPKLEDQRKIFSTHLGRYIRFPYMSLEKLREVRSCNILDDEFGYKAVVDALVFKIKTPHHHIAKAKASVKGSFARRDYQRRPVKVLEFVYPCLEFVIYFELMFDECTGLNKFDNPIEHIYSETFNFDGEPYRLYAKLYKDSLSREHFSVGMALDCDDGYAEVEYYDYEFAVRSKRAKKFVVKKSGSLDFTTGMELPVYTTPWDDFEAGKGLDFINGISYLELRLRIKE